MPKPLLRASAGTIGVSLYPSGSNPSVLPIDLIQQKVGTTADGSGGLVVNFDAPTAAGTMLIACLSFLDTASFTVDEEPEFAGMGNATEAITSTITGVKTYIFYTPNNGGDTMTFSVTLDLPVRCSAHISEWSGVADAAPQDTSDSTSAASATLGVVPATQDPTTANNLVVGIGGYVSATNTYSAGPSNSFTRLTPTGGASVFQECAYLIRTADHAAVTSDVTITSTAWAGCSASFGGL